MSDILPSRSSNNMISLIRISVNVISKCCIIVTLNHKNKYIMNKAFPTKPNTDTCDITQTNETCVNFHFFSIPPENIEKALLF